MSKIKINDLNKKMEYFCNSKENQYFDRKSARIKPIDTLKHLVAFANAEGGDLVIGIEDNGTITGFKTHGAHMVEEYKNLCLTALIETPILARFTTVNVINEKGEDDEILIISVDISSNRVIKSHDGKVYLRQSDKSVELKFEQILELQYDRGQSFFEDEIIPGTTIEDLDIDVIHEYMKHMGISNSSVQDVLDARNFIKNGNLTNAAIILFGKNPTKYLPQARLRIIKYDGMYAQVGKDINIIKEKTIEGPLPSVIKEAGNFINVQLREFQYLTDEGTFKTMPEYPYYAWFEGIVNAVTHRNYAIRGEQIKVILFDDRMEIYSPGKLPNIVTVENIRYQRYSRNPRIARVLSEFGWVKELNEGVKRIYSEMEKSFLNEPKYSEPNNNVLLLLENNVLNRIVRINDKIKEKISKEIWKDLSQEEKLIILFMYNGGQIMNTKTASKILDKGTTFCRKLLKTLQEKDLLVWHGSSVNDSTQYYSLKF